MSRISALRSGSPSGASNRRSRPGSFPIRSEARWFELRATTGLARLLRQQGRVEEGRDLLAQIVESISQGVDMPDWREAKALLDEVS